MVWIIFSFPKIIKCFARWVGGEGCLGLDVWTFEKAGKRNAPSSKPSCMRLPS
jgi:hypothetical protein